MSRPRLLNLEIYGLEERLLMPTIRIENEPGIIGPRAGRPAGPVGALAAGGPNSAVMVST